MTFFCVYIKTRKKLDKFFKSNRIKNKIILDIKEIVLQEGIEADDKMHLKIIILQKIQYAIEKKKDIYYIPDFENDFSIEKLLNIKLLLEKNDFNVLIFYNEFKKDTFLIEEVIDNISNFSNSQIIRDY